MHFRSLPDTSYPLEGAVLTPLILRMAISKRSWWGATRDWSTWELRRLNPS